MTDQTQVVPNEHSAAIPAAQQAGLLDKTDSTKFSAEALAAPDSYVRNFAHAVAAHEAQVVQAATAQTSFTSSNEVWSAFTELLKKAEADGFEVDVFEDSGQKHCVRVVTAGTPRLVLQSSVTGRTNKPANPAA